MFVSRKTVKNRRILQCAYALKPITFWYGQFVKLDWDFFLNYFEDLWQRLFKATMILEL